MRWIITCVRWLVCQQKRRGEHVPRTLTSPPSCPRPPFLLPSLLLQHLSCSHDHRRTWEAEECFPPGRQSRAPPSRSSLWGYIWEAYDRSPPQLDPEGTDEESRRTGSVEWAICPHFQSWYGVEAWAKEKNVQRMTRRECFWRRFKARIQVFSVCFFSLDS